MTTLEEKEKEETEMMRKENKEKGEEVSQESRRNGRGTEEEIACSELEEEEICQAVRKMKLGKAARTDGIPMEAYMYGGRTIREGVVELLKRVWKENYISEEWRNSVLILIYKKGDYSRKENYRGISLLCTAYKIYTEILRGRLEKEIKERMLLPESQAGFRKGRSTLDNIFILNHLIQREKGMKEKKIYILFVDLKVAFDTVEREKLWQILKEKGVSKEIRLRIRKIYKETKVAIKSKEKMAEEFWTFRGVRQGCILSPFLFNMYIADLDKYFREREIGGLKLDKERIWSVAYADDVVLMAKNREALNNMLDTLKKFLKDRNLVLNVEKTKIVVFNRSGKMKKGKWLWENRNI